MAIHVALLAVPAVAASGFLQAFQFAFLLWPFNLALPLARHLPRACVALRSLTSFYAAELRRRYVHGVNRRPQLQQPPPSSRQRWNRDEAVVAHAMIALVDISY